MPRFVLLVVVVLSFCAHASAQSPLPNIVVVGYWFPSNEMLRPFSSDPAKNPDGWIGQNWEGRGYDVYAFFPEFPAGGECGGEGDFRVDYQSTAVDFARVSSEMRPVAVVTFSVGATSIGWGLEPAYQRWRIRGETCFAGARRVPFYFPDCSGDHSPMSTPIATEPIGHIRLSNLPAQAIIGAVTSQMPGAAIVPFSYAYQPNGVWIGSFAGNYLSGFLPYLAAWYRDEHSPAISATPCYMSGHIHIGINLDVSDARNATEITLRSVIDSLNTMIPAPALAGGACCDIANGTCEFTTPADCGVMFLGNATSCDPDGCPAQTTGSCCYIDGTCTITVQPDCVDGPRVWVAEGMCDPNPCPPAPLGVCCRGATCSATVAAGLCQPQDGTAGAAFSAGNVSCDTPLGGSARCCAADYNKADGVTVQDIFDYIQDWMAGSPFACVGSDGESGVPVARDIFDFLGAWFAGCS